MKDSIKYSSVCWAIIIVIAVFSCSKEEVNIDFAPENPSNLVGNWVVFQFQGGNLEGQFSGPYYLTTALDANNTGILVLDNIFNSGMRAKAPIIADTAIYTANTAQLEVIKEGNYGIKSVSINGYFVHLANYSYEPGSLQSFIYSLAASTHENIAFGEEDIDDLIVFQAGSYDELNSPVDTFLVMGYRKTGFEEVEYNN